jgi:ABC-type phosphate/phosphonate transport system substrate-binding protein
LATSGAVPHNALVVRADLADELGPILSDLLLSMNGNPSGRAALEAFGAERFLSCRIDEYKAIYDMTDALAGDWDKSCINGSPPRRPVVVPAKTEVP